MAEPFIFISTSAVRDGCLDDYKKRFQEVRDIVEENEAKMHHFSLYLNEDGTEESTLQVHADADNMAEHMRLVGEHIQSASEYLDFSRMNIQIYGEPTDAVLDQMRQLAGSGVAVTVRKPVIGFNRLG